MSEAAPPGRQFLFVLGTGYLPDTITGGNISLHSLCARLASRGDRPIVLCRPRETNPATGIPGAPIPNYTVIRLADPTEAMHEMIARLAPAGVLVRGPWPASRAIERAIPAGHRLHIYFQTTLLDYQFPSPAQAPHLRYAANSPFLATLAQTYLGGPVAMIPSIIEPSEYACEPTGDAVLFVNPVASKGVHLAAAIAERLTHRRFLFLRSWPDNPGYPHVAVRHPNVEWTQSTFDMRTLYARARLLLVPSVLEDSSARIIGEAQISGIPAIVSDRGGLRDSVGGGGFVFSLADPLERWCEAVETLFVDQECFAACSSAAKEHAARPEYAPDHIVARFLEFMAS